MKEFDRIIEDYLKAKDTDYAIMINGDWGCGKSYYIKHDFVDTVIQTECPAPTTTGFNKYINHYGNVIREKWQKFKQDHKEEEAIYDEKHYFPFYITLYGISSVEEFYARVNEEVYGWISTGGNILQQLLENHAGAKVQLNAGAYIPHNAVLVFDDLERICLDKISPIEVLGLINSYAEHKHLKVIIVCNEEAFRKKSEKGNVQLKLDEEYQQYKEKTIRFTYTCTADVAGIYGKLIKGRQDAYGTYLMANQQEILELFAKGGRNNIRTLKFFLEVYKKVYDIVSSLSPEKYKSDIERVLMISALIYIMEYKRGIKCKDLLLLQQQISFSFEDFQSEDVFQSNKSKEEEHHEQPYDVSEAQKLYGAEYEEMVRLPWMVDYIATGALKEEDVKTYVAEQVELHKRIEKSPEARVVLKLKSTALLQDEEFPKLLRELWKNVKGNKYSTVELFDIYAVLATYTIEGIKVLDLSEEKDTWFKKAIEENAKKGIFIKELEGKLDKWAYEARDIEVVKRYYELAAYAVELNNAIANSTYGNEMDRFMEIVEDDSDEDNIVPYARDESHRLSLRTADWDRIYAALMKAPNPKAYMIIASVEHQLNNDYQNWTKDELNELKAFEDKIQAYIETGDGRLRTKFMHSLLRTIREFLQKNR